MTRVITIRLEIPEGVEVRIGGGPPDDADDEPLPPAPWNATDADRAGIPDDHGRSQRVDDGLPSSPRPVADRPGGGLEEDGRPYAAFVTCPEPGCDERPSATRRTAS